MPSPRLALLVCGLSTMVLHPSCSPEEESASVIQANTLLASNDAPNPWIVRVGDTAVVHVQIRDDSGAEVPEADIPADSIYLDGTVTVERTGVSDFTISLAPRCFSGSGGVAQAGFAEIVGVLTTTNANQKYDTSAVQLPIGRLIVYGGPPNAVHAVTNLASLVVGEKRGFAALVTTGFHDPNSNTDREARSEVPPTWTTNNPSVVEVTPDGLATAKALGSAVLTASAEGFYDDVQVTVVEGTMAPPGDLNMEVLATKEKPLQWPASSRWFAPNPLDMTDHSQLDEKMGQLAFDSHGNPVVVGLLLRNKGETPYDGAETLLGTWTGTGMGFAYVQESFEIARTSKLAIDDDDRVWVVYLGSEPGLRLADRLVHDEGGAFRHRTLNTSTGPYVKLDPTVLRPITSGPVAPRGVTIVKRPGGGVYVAAVFAWRDPSPLDNGCVELVRLWAIHGDQVESTDVRNLQAYLDPNTQECINRSEAQQGSGPIIQLLDPLPGEQWPRVLYLSPVRRDLDTDQVPFIEKTKGFSEFRYDGAAWTSRWLLPEGLTGVNSVPLVFMPMAYAVPRSTPDDPTVVFGRATPGHTFAINSNLVPFALVRDPQGDWHVARDSFEQELVFHSDDYFRHIMADNGLANVFGNTMVWPLADDYNAAGFANGKLWVTNRISMSSSVIDRSGGLRGATIQDPEGNRPEDFFISVTDGVVGAWGSGAGKVAMVYGSGDGRQLASGTMLRVVVQPRATPRFAGNFDEGQRLGDSSVPDLPFAAPALDADGRIWVQSSTYGPAMKRGEWFVSDVEQTRLEKLPSSFDSGIGEIHGPLPMNGATVFLDTAGQFVVASSDLSGGQPGPVTERRSLAGELPFHPSTELVLPNGAYFGVSADESFDLKFHRRFCPDILGSGEFVDLTDPDASPFEGTRVGRESAQLLRDGEGVLLVSLVQEPTPGLPNLKLESFDANGTRTARKALFWDDPSVEIVPTTAAILDSNTLVAFARNLSVHSLRVVRLDRNTGAQTSVEVGTWTGVQPARPLLVLPDGTVVAGWEEPYGFGSRVVIRASHDGGITWGETIPVWPGGGLTQVMMHLLPLKNGKVLVFFADRGVLSKDTGRMAPFPFTDEFGAFMADTIAISVQLP